MSETHDRIADPWGSGTPYGRDEPWPVRVDTFLADGLAPDDVDGWYIKEAAPPVLSS